MLEHHSNDLPWRARTRVVHVRALPDGSLDLDDLDRLLALHAGRVGLLAVTGASNVTGVVPPVHDLAERVHAVGGRILVDAAQLVAHRPIDMRPHDDPGHLDFLALLGPQDVRPARHRCADRPARRVPPPPPPAGRRHRPGGHRRRRGVGRPPRSGGGRQPQRRRGRGPGRGGEPAGDHRSRPDRRPRAGAHPVRHGAAGPRAGAHHPRADRRRRRAAEGRRRAVHARRVGVGLRRRRPRPRARHRRAERVLLRPALCRPPAVAPTDGDAGRGGDRRRRRHGADQPGRLQRHR